MTPGYEDGHAMNSTQSDQHLQCFQFHMNGLHHSVSTPALSTMDCEMGGLTGTMTREQDGCLQSSQPAGPQFVVRVVKRRNTANKKERRRTQSINTAFSDLRECIPNVPADTKLSKVSLVFFIIFRFDFSEKIYLVKIILIADKDFEISNLLHIIFDGRFGIGQRTSGRIQS